MGLTAAQKKLIENNPPEKVTVEAPTKPGRQPTATSAASALSTLSLPTPEQVRLGNVAGYMGAQLDKAASVPKSGTSVKPEGISGQEWAYRLQQQAQKQAQGRGGGEHSARTETSEKKQNVFGLIGGSVAGGGLKSAAGFVGAGGTLAKGADITGRNFTDRTMANQVNRVSEAMGRATLAARRGDMNAARSYSADAARSRAELQQMQEAQEAQALRSNTTPLAQAANKLDKTYENINDKANQTIARAQAGQSGLGKTASDVIVAGTQMLGDAPANLIVPGGSLMMMGARSFGDASQQARLNGANVGEQFGYGIGNAAVEVVSEKLFDGLAGLYGKGGADEVVEKVINRLAKTDKGRSALKVLSSMSGEALEEVFSGIVDPALESIYNGKDVRDNYSKETAAEIAYSALIGGILGGLGGSVDLAKGNVSELDTTPRKLDGSPIVTRTAQTDNAPRMLNGQPIAPRTAAQTATDTTAATGANLGAKNAPDGATQTITSRQNIQRYSDDIDAVFKGDYPSGRVITMGETPDLLLRYGASQRPVTLTQEAAYKIAYPEGYMGGKHNLGMSALKQLPYQIADPVAIMRSTSEDNSLVLLTAWKDGNTDVIIPLHLDKTGAIGLENRVPSAYGKGNIDAIIGKNNENVLYTKNNEDIHQLLSKGVQFPQAMADDILAKNSIPDAAPKVNMENATDLDRAPRMLNGQPTQAVSNLDTNGPQGTEADRAPRMLDGTVEKAFKDVYPDDYLDMAAEYANPIAKQTSVDELISAKTEKQRKSLREKADESWSYFKRKMLDSGEAVTREAKATGDKHLYAYYNMARASTNAATSMITDGATDVRGRKTGKSLNDIFGEVRAKGDDYYNAFQTYLLHMHNIDRMSRDNQSAVNKAESEFAAVRASYPELLKFADHQIENMAVNEYSDLHDEAVEYVKARNNLKRAEAVTNKPVFGYDVSAEDSLRAAAELQSQHPEFADKAKEVYGYIDNLMRYRVDSGLITEADYQHLKEVYPHYVPTYRIFEQEQSGGKRGKGVKIGKTIGTATGSNQKIMPLHEAIAKQTMSVVREGSKNRFGQRMLNNEKSAHILSKSEYDGTFSEDLFDELKDSAETFAKENSFIVRENGKMYEMTVTPAMFEAVKALSPDREEVNTFTKTVRTANDVFKRLVTGDNPVFLARNFMRDLQDAGIYSKDLSEFAKDYPQAVNEIARDGEYWQMYKALGGTYSSIFDFETGNVDEHAGWRKNTLDRIEALNEAVEQAPRLAEFMATVKKNGGLNADMDTLMDAMYNAADVTVNFGRSGTLAKKLNANYIPFLNPGIQGFDKLVRTFTETAGAKDWLRLAAKCALFGIAPRLISELLYKDDEDWDSIRDSDKDTYYLFKIKDGLWLKLPKGRTLSVIGAGADRIADAVRGEDVDAGQYAEFFLTQTAPANPLKENILRAWFDADLLNKESPGRTWYGSDIESQRLQNYAPAERYDARTDEVSKWLGQKLGLSPKKINYLLDQYSGVIGDVFLPMMTPTAERDMFSAAFTLDSAASNRLSNDFYEAKDALTYAKNGEEATGADAVMYKWINKQSSAVSEVNKAIRDIEADESLSDKEKKEQLHVQYAIRNGVEKAALSTQDAYREAAQRYYDASTAEKESDRVNEAYREANREVYGAEYALKAYDKDVYENAAALNEKGVSWDDFYNVYFGMKSYKDLKGAEKSNAERDVIRESGLPEETKFQLYEALIDKEGSRADEYEAFRAEGLTIDQFLQAQNAYARINDEANGAQAKAQEFARWVNSQGLTPAQEDVEKQSFAYYSQIKQDGTRYDKLLDAGLSDRQAYDLANEIRALRPEDGKTGVSDLQKSSVIVNASLPIDQQLRALASTMSESEYGKVQAGVSVGVAPADYVTLLETLPGVDDGNGTYSQAEVKAAIDAMDAAKSTTYGKLSIGGLSTEQKAALWQMANKGWKAKNNPYSVRVGQQVYDAIHGIVIENPPQTLYAAPDVSNMSALDRILASKGTP